MLINRYANISQLGHGKDEWNPFTWNTKTCLSHIVNAMAAECLGIDLNHKSHNAPLPYPTMNHFVTEYANMCTFLLQNGALWDICLMHCGICTIGLLFGIVSNQQVSSYGIDIFIPEHQNI